MATSLMPNRGVWCSSIVVIGIIATLGGLLAMAVQRVRVTAERTSDL
jgi:hypothetical protein